jgi:hypothetical protein
MKLDRTRALVLVGLLASSCVITTEDDDDPNNSGEAGAPGEGGSATTGGRSSTGGDSAAGESSEGGVAGAGDSTSEGGAAGAAEPSEEGGSGGEPSSTGGVSTGGVGTGGTTGGSNSTGGAPTDEGIGGGGGAGEEPGICSDTEGEYPGCEGITVDPSCEGLDTFQIGKCERATTYFKPRIAEMIQYCVVDQTPLERCDATLTYTCIDLAIQDSCPDDDEALEACATILSSCDEVEADACLTYLSAMTATGKDETVACMVEGLYCDLYSCAEGL